MKRETNGRRVQKKNLHPEVGKKTEWKIILHCKSYSNMVRRRLFLILLKPLGNGHGPRTHGVHMNTRYQWLRNSVRKKNGKTFLLFVESVVRQPDSAIWMCQIFACFFFFFRFSRFSMPSAIVAHIHHSRPVIWMASFDCVHAVARIIILIETNVRIFSSSRELISFTLHTARPARHYNY